MMTFKVTDADKSNKNVELFFYILRVYQLVQTHSINNLAIPEVHKEYHAAIQ